MLCTYAAKFQESIYRLQFTLLLHLLHAVPGAKGKRFGPTPVIAGPRTASLSRREPGRNALHDDGASESKKCISPNDIAHRIVSRHFMVPAHAFLTRWQTRRPPGLERLGRRICPLEDVRTGDVAKVRQRVPDRRHFPVEDANDSRLRVVEDQIVDLVVAVDQGAPIPRLRRLLREEAHHVFEVWQFADGLLAVCVEDLGLSP